jgi:hypothetical protein
MSVILQNGMEYRSVNADPCTCMKTPYIQFINSLLDFVIVSQIVREGHVSLTSAVFLTTAAFWW